MSSPSFEAGWLGLLHGSTEVLPLSSGGHLALAAMLFDLESGDVALRVALHGGVLAATLIVLRARVIDALAQGARGLVQPSRFRETAGGRDALAVMVASVPTAAIGFALEKLAERDAPSPLVVGVGFLLTTAALLSARWAPKGTLEAPTLWGAFLIGAAQGVAMMPGLSRSGCALCLALWLGLREGRAFELAMLASLPAVIGPLALELSRVPPGAAELGPAAVGGTVSLLSATLALMLLRWTTLAGRLPLFALWTFPIGIATLAMARAWPG